MLFVCLLPGDGNMDDDIPEVLRGLNLTRRCDASPMHEPQESGDDPIIVEDSQSQTLQELSLNTDSLVVLDSQLSRADTRSCVPSDSQKLLDPTEVEVAASGELDSELQAELANQEERVRQRQEISGFTFGIPKITHVRTEELTEDEDEEDEEEGRRNELESLDQQQFKHMASGTSDPEIVIESQEATTTVVQTECNQATRKDVDPETTEVEPPRTETSTDNMEQVPDSVENQNDKTTSDPDAPEIIVDEADTLEDSPQRQFGGDGIELIPDSQDQHDKTTGDPDTPEIIIEENETFGDNPRKEEPKSSLPDAAEKSSHHFDEVTVPYLQGKFGADGSDVCGDDPDVILDMQVQDAGKESSCKTTASSLASSTPVRTRKSKKRQQQKSSDDDDLVCFIPIEDDDDEKNGDDRRRKRPRSKKDPSLRKLALHQMTAQQIVDMVQQQRLEQLANARKEPQGNKRDRKDGKRRMSAGGEVIELSDGELSSDSEKEAIEAFKKGAVLTSTPLHNISLIDADSISSSADEVSEKPAKSAAKVDATSQIENKKEQQSNNHDNGTLDAAGKRRGPRCKQGRERDPAKRQILRDILRDKDKISKALRARAQQVLKVNPHFGQSCVTVADSNPCSPDTSALVNEDDKVLSTSPLESRVKDAADGVVTSTPSEKV